MVHYCLGSGLLSLPHCSAPTAMGELLVKACKISRLQNVMGLGQLNFTAKLLQPRQLMWLIWVTGCFNGCPSNDWSLFPKVKGAVGRSQAWDLKHSCPLSPFIWECWIPPWQERKLVWKDYRILLRQKPLMSLSYLYHCNFVSPQWPLGPRVVSNKPRYENKMQKTN